MPLLLAWADPIDTALDFLSALEHADGAAVTGLLSHDMSLRLDEVFTQLALLGADNPDMLAAALARFGGRLAPEDLAVLTRDEIIGKLLEGRTFPLEADITRENAVLEGRNATVVLDFTGGGSISFRMVWEESTWKIADTSLLTQMLF